MRLGIVAVMVAILSPSFPPAAESAPCSAGTVAMIVGSTDNLQDLTKAMSCTGEGAFDVTWIGSLQLQQRIELSDNKNLTITGSSPLLTGIPEAELDAGNVTGLFQVSGGSTLRLQHVVLKGGSSAEGGVVDVRSSSSVHVVGCCFMNNNASLGGAIFAHSSEIHIDGVTRFEQNTANRDGGAIYVNRSEIHIVGETLFAENSAGQNGGVIYLDESGLHVDGDTSFTNNLANGYGGAIYALETKVQVDGNTAFDNNSAEVHGGAVHTCFGRTYINGTTTFGHNSAGGSGGAIRAATTEIHIDGHTSFTDNVGYTGGAIYGSTLNMSISGETNFANNSAAFDGGAILTHTESVVNITGHTSFEDNSAANTGGALYSIVSTWRIDGDTSFMRNTAGAQGGALAAPSTTTLSIGGVTSFSENVATWRGGAILVKTSEFRMDGISSFIDNSAYDGGSMLADHASVNIDGNTSFSRSSALNNGGAINMRGSNASIMGLVEFSWNTALNGGGIYSSESPQFDIVGMISFLENTAVLDGGAILLDDPTEFDIFGTSFVSNEASFGGAVSLTSTTRTTGWFRGCRFDSNDASNGGALYLSTGDPGEIESSTFVQDSIFHHNIADKSGGGLFNVGSLAVNNTVFSENTAADSGLAIANKGSPLELWNATFHGNMLSCPPEEYSDFDDRSSGNCRLQLVCEECLDGCEVNQTIATTTSDLIPSCRAVPVGVSQVSTTTLGTFDLMPGYFRVSADSRDILECYRQESCTGGDNALNYCATGYTGPYCAVCAYGYSAGMLDSCHKCSTEHRDLAIGLAIGVLVLAIAVAAWLVPRLLRKTEGQERVCRWQMIPSSYTVAINALPLPAVKIVVVVLQIITQFTEIAGAVYPDEYQAFLSKLTPINLDIGFILSNLCIVKTDFYDRLLISTMWPLVVIAALSGASYITRKMNGSTELAEPIPQRKYLATGIFVLFVVYSSVSFRIFQTFVCDGLDDGNAYLRADYSVQCRTDTHDAYMTYASVMVCIYPVGIPALFGWWLTRNRQDLDKPDRQPTPHLLSFRGLWSAYRPSCYYYEVVECCRRVLLTGAAVFVLPNSGDQIAAVLLVAVIFMFISESLSPFENNHDMWLYRSGNAIILISMYVALLLKVELAGDESRILLAMTVALIMANVCMIASVLVQVVLLVKGLCLSRTVQDVHRAPSSFA